jgi:hypothetical protein
MSMAAGTTFRRFTPDDIERIRWMAGRQCSGKAIARALGRTPQSVRVKCVELGISLRPERTDGGRVVVSRETRKAFEQAAAKRNVTTMRLINQVLLVVALDGLIDAVLDDRPRARFSPKLPKLTPLG